MSTFLSIKIIDNNVEKNYYSNVEKKFVYNEQFVLLCILLLVISGTHSISDRMSEKETSGGNLPKTSPLVIGSGGSRMSNPWSVGMRQFLAQMEMAYLHWRKRTQVQARIRILNPMATLYYAECVHIALT